MAQHYEAAGVNLEAGYEVVSRIKSHVKSTNRFGSMGNIGSFGGMFDLGTQHQRTSARERHRWCRYQTQTRFRDGQA